MTTKKEIPKNNLKKVTEKANKMSAVDIAVKKYQNLAKLTKDRAFMLVKSEELKNKLAEVEDSEEEIFEEERGLRLELSENWSNSIVKISHQFVIVDFIKYMIGQIDAKISEIEDQIIKE